MIIVESKRKKPATILKKYPDAILADVTSGAKDGLKDFKVTHALYLDMGSGWNYAWYRDKDGSVKEIFPESKISPCYKYRTNWIAFYK